MHYICIYRWNTPNVYSKQEWEVRDIIIDSINLINRNKELFYDITCKVKNINSLHIFIDDIKQINSVKEVERIFI